MDLPKLDNSNLLDKTYLILKDRISRRDFKPNEKISIPELSAQLGVSRTPIRDALNRLEKDGLVKTVPKVGTYVNAFDIDDILDIIDTRLMLEFWVVEKLASLPDDQLAAGVKKLEGVLRQADDLVERASFESFLKSDFNLKFHSEFLSLARNKRNVEIYQGLMSYHFLAVEHSLITKEMATTAIAQHSSVVNALKNRNYAELRTAIQLHLNDAKERLLQQLKANGGQI